jgi:hypothetical protein
MQRNTRRTSINGPRDFYEVIELIWAVEYVENQIQKFEQMSSQVGNITQCENH